MPDVTQILSAIEQGDPSVAEQLLPLFYDELRRLASPQMARDRPGETLNPTALVHDEAPPGGTFKGKIVATVPSGW
jgi:hypothetical protein